MPAESLLACLASHPEDRVACTSAVRSLGGPAGVFFDDLLDAWVVTSHADCVRLSSAPELSRGRVALPDSVPEDLRGVARSLLGLQMMFRDDDEARARRAFWAGQLSTLSDESLEALADDALTAVRGPEVADLYGQVLRPYVSRVVCAQLGLREPVGRALRVLVDPVVDFLDGRLADTAGLTRALAAMAALYGQLAPQVPLQRPGSYDREPDAWLADLMLVLVAGHESTAYLLATALAHRDAPARSSVSLLVEALRYDCPVQLVGRVVARPLVVGSVPLPVGARVYLHLGAANHDPGVFAEPDRFVPDRAVAPLAFGPGPGGCVGRTLAMRSARVMLDRLLARDARVGVSDVVGRHGVAGLALARLPARLREAEVAC